MAKRIFITATNTDIGKTYTACLLLHSLAKAGLRVGVYKPIETGVTSLPPDGKRLFDTASALNPALQQLTLEDIVTLQFPLPASPYVASGGRKIGFDMFDRALAKIEALCDVVVIEGAGGLFVPVDADTMMIDFPRHFGATTLLVTHCRLGCINDTLLNLKALKDARLPFVWGFNCRDGELSFEQTSLPYFRERFEKLWFIRNDIDAIARSLLDTIA